MKIGDILTEALLNTFSDNGLGNKIDVLTIDIIIDAVKTNSNKISILNDLLKDYGLNEQAIEELLSDKQFTIIIELISLLEKKVIDLLLSVNLPKSIVIMCRKSTNAKELIFDIIYNEEHFKYFQETIATTIEIYGGIDIDIIIDYLNKHEDDGSIKKLLPVLNILSKQKRIVKLEEALASLLSNTTTYEDDEW